MKPTFASSNKCQKVHVSEKSPETKKWIQLLCVHTKVDPVYPLVCTDESLVKIISKKNVWSDITHSRRMK